MLHFTYRDDSRLEIGSIGCKGSDPEVNQADALHIKVGSTDFPPEHQFGCLRAGENEAQWDGLCVLRCRDGGD
jgi:hypothetical protein